MRTVLSELFARFVSAGIGDAKKRARYSDDIQLVSLVDDFSLGRAGIPFEYDNVIPSTVGNVYELVTFTAGPLRSTVELVAGGRGIWLLAALHSTSTAANIATWTRSAVRAPALATIFTPTQANATCYGDGGDSLSEFRAGDAAEDVPADTPTRIALVATNAGEGAYKYPQALFIAPGQVVTQQRIGSNTNFPLGFTWRDIPLA